MGTEVCRRRSSWGRMHTLSRISEKVQRSCVHGNGLGGVDWGGRGKEEEGGRGMGVDMGGGGGKGKGKWGQTSTIDAQKPSQLPQASITKGASARLPPRHAQPKRHARSRSCVRP